MQINSNHNSKTSFKCIKIVKCSNEEYAKIIKQFGKELTDSGYIFFKNRSTGDCATFNTLNTIAERISMTEDWLIANCKQHNINLPDINTSPMYVFSEKDIFNLLKFRIKDIFSEIKNAFCILSTTREYPEHLQAIKMLNNHAEKSLPKFQKFLHKNNAQELSYEDYLKELTQKYLHKTVQHEH